jgi:hypothetical protein
MVDAINDPSVMLTTWCSCLVDRSIAPNSNSVDVLSEEDHRSWHMLADIENNTVAVKF